MKNFTTLLTLCLFFSFVELQAQWTDNGTNLTTQDNVGIGTTSPGEKLDVAGVIQSSRPNPEYSLFDSGDNRQEGQLYGISNEIQLQSFFGALRFGTGSNGSPTLKMSILENGNVGIGSGFPNQKLEVNGAVKISNTNINSNGAIRYNGFNFQGHHNGIWKNLDEEDTTVWSNFGGSDSFYVNGNIGIGTFQASHLLHVAGDVAVAGSVVTPSDERLKENIVPLSDALEIIAALNPSSYHYVPESAEKFGLPSDLQFGLIAQEVARVVPELVIEKALESEDGIVYQGIEYTQLIPILTQAIKELHESKQELIEQNTAQALLLSSVVKRLEKLENLKTTELVKQ